MIAIFLIGCIKNFKTCKSNTVTAYIYENRDLYAKNTENYFVMKILYITLNFKFTDMKKLILTIFIASLTVISSFSQNGKLEVGMKAPDWVFTDADKKEFTMDSWAGKVLQINYVDPDESDMNDPFNDAVNKAADVDKIINRDFFKGFGIVDTKSTWKPNGLIRMIAGNKAKKYNTTILFDYKGILHESWGLTKDNYTVVILDKNRVCRALFEGKIPETENQKIIDLIIELTKEQ
jgi:predicted transcriptional regulator